MSAPARDIRLLLSDVDGTLVTKNKVLTTAARDVVRELDEAGVGFAITSSRPPQGLRMLIEPLALRMPIASLNGGLYVRPDLSVIQSHRIDAAEARRAVNFFLSEGLDVWIYTEDEWLIRDASAPHVAREAWILKIEPVVVEAFTDEHVAAAVKIVGVSDDRDRAAECERLSQVDPGRLAIATRSEPYFLDVTNPHATKGGVALTLAKLLSISPEQIATIGDMPSDVLMFRKSGLSIVMGNASDLVKVQASEVTDTNENDGFARAVRAFVLGAPLS